MRNVLTVAVALACLAIGGCMGPNYYRITDPTSGRTYYTKDNMAWRYRHGGAVSFYDIKTGKHVTLQNSEIEPVDDDEGMRNTKNY